MTEAIAPGSEALRLFTESAEGLWWVRAGGGETRGWNNIRYQTGLSGKNTPARALSMNVASVPPRGIAYAHIHDGFEVMLLILQGHVRHEYGPNLEFAVEHHAGDFIFIEPGVPHEVFNLSDSEPVVAVVARSAADEWDRIVDVPSRHRDAALARARSEEPAP
ncbi:MAG: cupin domain-containing protein [Caldilineaceae bacterium]